MRHVNVDLSRSGPHDVTLRVRKELTGVYKCEVSADAPLFTAIRMAYDRRNLPSGNPVMNIEPNKVEIGKPIRAKCYSPGSDPAANLTWFINVRRLPQMISTTKLAIIFQVSGDEDNVKIYALEIETDLSLGLHSSKSVVEITTQKSDFAGGVMTIKCECSIYDIWMKSVEKVVRDNSPQPAPVLGGSTFRNRTDQITGT
ncbi:hypothetical protein NQ317_002409 [Molorchus minor]|uniref:CD80-like immunoglobulin C2-set domain-containing protein n=1 Tax=Molorchus minor TaxID=1323400 RepID=A0ABQ9JKS4_9CUCU|nr:hypothetical protein NQ317_002409 [Molorchus minor]